MASIPSEDDLRSALASVLLVDNNDDEGVVDGIDGACVHVMMRVSVGGPITTSITIPYPSLCGSILHL